MDLVEAYKQMAEHTKEECNHCKSLSPTRCCSIEYCNIARADHNLAGKKPPEPLNLHGVLYLDENFNCVIPPHMRPMCTLHHCDIASLGFLKRAGGEEWTKKYFELREQINELKFDPSLWLRVLSEQEPLGEKFTEVLQKNLSNLYIAD